MFDFKSILSSLESTDWKTWGRMYRGAARLHDGTFLPCVTLQSKAKLVAYARRRLKEELLPWRFKVSGYPHANVVSHFVSEGNRINDYDIAEVMPSKYAVPRALGDQVVGETFMSSTCWVFEMSDGELVPFSYPFPYFEFLALPDGYSFDDVAKVHNHSYVSLDGQLTSLEQGQFPPEDYWKASETTTPQVVFYCAIKGI